MASFERGLKIMEAGFMLSLLTFAGATPVPVASSSTSLPTTAAYWVIGSTTTFATTTMTATGTDECVLIAKETGVAYLNDVTIIKTGDTTSDSDSSFTDLNSAIGIESDAQVVMTGGTISTNGESANAVHTYVDGSGAILTDVTITAEGDGSHGIYTGGGTIYGYSLVITTTGEHASAIATDEGGGLIVVDIAAVVTEGENSALVYSTGNITASYLTGTTSVAPAAVIDGSNSITLTDPVIKCGTEQYGVFQVSSTSATSATDSTAYIYVTDGSIEETRGEYGLIYVGNSELYVYLNDVDVTIDSGILANASADSSWGTSGDNGGILYLEITDMTVEGDIYLDDISYVYVTLVDSNWTGTFSGYSTTSQYSVTKDSSSTWTDESVAKRR